MRLIELLEGTRCWKGYKKHGTKMMFGKRVPDCRKVESQQDVEEDLRAWFGKGKKGGAGGGGWDRYNTKGERIGKKVKANQSVCQKPERRH